MAGIWAEVLELERVGLGDNFFELGGHSLLATQVSSRLQAQLGIKLPLRELFEAPTLAAFAARVEQGVRKQTLPAALPALGPISRSEELPLSFAQSRLWFVEQMEPGSSAYTIPAAARMKGPLNFEALQRALLEIMQRHEALRTRFISASGRPVQVVDQTTGVDLETTDLTGIPEVERDSAVNSFLRQAARGFDLQRGPLFRAHLLRLADDHHILIITMHHIVSDGWSVGVFIRELQHLYEAFAQGTPIALPNLPVQYVDYAIWQREYLKGEILDQHLNYWKERLADLNSLNLRVEEQSEPFASGAAAIESLELSEQLSAQLRTLSRREGATLFMTLLAAFKLVLARRCGQEDIAIGTPIAGRLLPEWENLIGFFVNTLVMRTSCGGNPTFRQLLGRVKETALGAYAHQDLPFEKLVEELHPDRSLSRHPFFDVLFNHVNVPLTRAQLTGLELEVLEVNGADSKFPLTIYTHDDNQRIRVRIAYRQTLFSAEQITLMLDQYREALSQMVQRPDDSIASYSLVTDRMRSLLPDPRAEISQPRFGLITEMFNQQVIEAPANVAVTQRGREWSYKELSASANDITLTLLSLGLEPGQTVAVCGEKSFGLIAGILAAGLSGGVLLTLDRKLPAARQRTMFKISRVKYVLYAGSVRPEDAWIFERSGIESLTLDPQSGSVVAHNGQALRRENSERRKGIALPPPATANAAYVCFTSGTTGVPKGVLGSHQGLSHFISWQREEFGIGPGDRSAQLTGLSFDVVLRDIFLPLTSGATLCLPDDEEQVVSEKVLEWLNRERVSILHTVPSLAESWLGLPDEAAVSSLRVVFFAGEPLTSKLIQRWRYAVSSGCQIVNLYGPTETTLAKCFYRVPVDCLPGVQPVGEPIPQTQALIFRDGDQLCGLEEIGEVVIRTPFRSLGYLNASDEKRRFVKNPYRDEAQDLLYHTGDKGRYRSDGTLELLGRIDDQVKLRGHRIEPGEIECVLRKHAEVRNAAVLVRSAAAGEKRLVAYVALVNNSSLSPAALRSYLRSQLPEYMVPAAFMLMSALPLTANGKINREALRDPEQPAENGYEQPRDEIEELLAGIWSEVLKVELVGRDQNFFDLGGHSLIATQVISRVREIFRVDLAVRSLFSNPTIAGIAAEIRATRSADQTPTRPQLRRVERGPHLPLSFAQQRLWFIDQLEPGGHAYVIPAAVRLTGELNEAAVGAALVGIARRHENLRTRFINANGTPMQVIDQESDFELRLVDLAEQVSGEELESRTRELLRDEATRGFELSREHLFRALLIRLSATEHVLLITIHHIVSDAWSMGLLLEEFKAFYQAYDEDQPPALPDLSVQYADYAAWQRDYLRGQTQQQQLSYWRQQLHGAEALELPTDRPRPPVQTYRGASEPFTLSAPLVKDIRQLGRREGCTLFMTLLAAFQILLAKSSGQRDVLVGTPIAGRIHPDLEALIGFFVNTVVMRARMNGDPTVREILQGVREAALGGFANQDLPFEKLIEDLQPARDPSRSPLFQVMFIFQHASRKHEEFKRLGIEPLDLEMTTAKFDLTLTVLGDTEELNCVIEYNTDLFERDRILRLIRHLQLVLEAITTNPDLSFSALTLLDHKERRQVIEDWNATEFNYSEEQNVARLFERQAAMTPERVAFIAGERRITYGELNRRANGLARRLRQSGAREESRVAVCMRRSPDLMVALLAVIKAGAAYVPIDPQLPDERIAMMLGDSNARVVLTEHSWSDRITPGHVEVICLEADWHDIETYETSNLSVNTVGDSALYLIYTSGSTGQPKGVIGTHRGAVNRFHWMWERFPFEVGEVTCLKTSFSFVDSVWECLGPLLAGVPGVIIPEATVSNTEALISQLAKENVTRIVLVPSLLESLVENHSNLGTLLPALRLWVCSGESLSGQLVERFHAAVPDGQLVNLYGCSEVAADVTYHIAERTPTALTVPIGRPVANTQVYILDESMSPCGIGLPGQIYVGGSHLARGYWNRPDETADRFVPNPFATHDGERLYRTGDLGRYLTTGEIEYLGRMDSQFKVRGYRIESGEIESALMQHPKVRMAQVVAAGAGRSEKKLVAYVVLVEAMDDVIRELHDYAARFLPSYMIPSAFVPLERFPLLPSGKVDRRSLPAASREHTLSAGPASQASTPVEASLVEIWREVLGLDQVGIYDNFFDLGGHSLALVKLRARIESRFGRRLSLPDLFTYPSIAALSQRLQEVETTNDILARLGPRMARQKAASRIRRQRWAEQRQKQPAYQFTDQAGATQHQVEGQLT
ncbi:MAG TPA: amino acid adenylation domain-containing protein [Pyrinomonadaceae bacterium]|nr:amino acid adenylation domain-containing protein [Pyrinomonadaceae bacterium]